MEGSKKDEWQEEPCRQTASNRKETSCHERNVEEELRFRPVAWEKRRNFAQAFSLKSQRVQQTGQCQKTEARQSVPEIGGTYCPDCSGQRQHQNG